LEAPFFSNEDLRQHAYQFLSDFNVNQTIPVPIELIVEQDLVIDIVPMPGLQGAFDVVAYISADKTEIRVDEYVYYHRPERYRFSLAHEVGHWYLHSDLWGELTFSTVTDWKNAVSQIPDKENAFLEWHANQFAGLILVPPCELQIVVDGEIEKLRAIGSSPSRFPMQQLTAAIAVPVARHFEVSTIVAERRIRDDQSLQRYY